jgi:hypothetical protein
VDVVVLNELPRKRKLLTRRFLRQRGIVNYLDLAVLVLRDKVSAKVNVGLNRIFPGRTASSTTTTEEGFDENRPASFAGVLSRLERELNGDAGVTYVDFARINATEAIDSIKQMGLDRLMTCGAPLLRKRFIRNSPPILNPHCGIVPKYRGSSPFHWAIYNGDFDSIGYTIHLVTPAVDGGDVVLRKKVTPRPEWSLTDIDWYLVRRMYLDLVEIISAKDFEQRLAHAESQDLSRDSWPPMGFFRTWSTRRRLRRWQEAER